MVKNSILRVHERVDTTSLEYTSVVFNRTQAVWVSCSIVEARDARRAHTAFSAQIETYVQNNAHYKTAFTFIRQ